MYEHLIVCRTAVRQTSRELTIFAFKRRIDFVAMQTASEEITRPLLKSADSPLFWPSFSDTMNFQKLSEKSMNIYNLRRPVMREVLSTRIWGVPPAGGPLL